MDIIIRNTGEAPIYDQITRQIKALILTGALGEGEMLPSMRALAQDLRISVITTKRAYEELEREGFITTVPGKGCFVAPKNLELARENALRQVEEHLQKAVEAANIIAPEHLEVCVDEPFALLDAIQNAGSIFLGKNVPEALGDYWAGPNHTLPTSGTARFSSPLSVDDFVKKSSFIYYPKPALAKVAGRIEDFAEREGLQAHARSVAIRFAEEERQ